MSQEAFKDSNLETALYVAQECEDAISFLTKKNKYRHVPTPDPILPDPNLQKKDGREVFKIIKTAPVLKQIHVMILTKSKAEEAVSRAYNLHANSSITQPVNLDGFINVVQFVRNFELKVAQLPPK